MIDRLARIGTARWQWRRLRSLLEAIGPDQRPAAVAWFGDDFLTTAWHLHRRWPDIPVVRELKDGA